jgi:quercetin dioxygenase-like cupin family protein
MGTEPIVVDARAAKGRRTAFGDVMRWVVGEGDVEGAFSLHHRTAPPGSASVVHTHERFVEAFYVLSGQLEFEVGGQTIEGQPGTYVQAPKGVSHAWRVVGDVPAEALVVFTPSLAQRFFEEMDTEVRAGADPARLRAINKKYGLD